MPPTDPTRAALLEALHELRGRPDVSDFASAFAFLRKYLSRRTGAAKDPELETEFRATEHAIVGRLIESIDRGPTTIPGAPMTVVKK
jgi:hypothetical protein